MVIEILGGIGLFLLGMMLMTDGLKSLAGDALRSMLARVVRGPVSGVSAGAAATALVQSSSATTLTTIGFVSAGLLTFTQSVGVIFGANIGTTSTGWIVSQLGFKVSISAVAMPALFIGVLMRLLFRYRLGVLGFALGGFGLIFIGLDVLQEGMSALAGRFDPSDLPGAQAGLFGTLLLIGVGVVMTVVMQSSSAAVATTLTALHADTINLDQAAALVIGQNIGTTITALIASIGASTPARRTALSHILFNVFTGIVAFALLPVFGAVMGGYVDGGGPDAAITAVAGFHTAFNVLGVALLLPLVRPFCGLIERVLPQREPSLTRFLDPSVTKVLPVAIEAARHTLIEIVEEIIEALSPTLHGRHQPIPIHSRLQPVSDALVQTRQFLNQLTAEAQTQRESRRHLAVLHAIDHVGRLNEVCHEDWPTDKALRDPLVRETAGILVRALPTLQAWFAQPDEPAPHEEITAAATSIADRRRELRTAILQETSEGRRNAQDALALLEAVRLIDQVTYHLWRATWHLQPAPPKDDSPGADIAGDA